DIRPAFKTGDIIKGSVTVDPDGYPLVYTGSRDNYFRILSVDKNNTAAELWKLWAYDDKIIWNDDWDGNPLIVDGILYQSGENGWFYAIELNRGYDENGYVTVNPQVLVRTPLFDDAWIDRVGDTTLSIESSPAYHDGRVYVANSGGRVVGFDVANITDGIAPIVFDFWAGDDTDATIVVDEDGMLYVASELERKTKRSDELGQIMKLNPYSDEPFVWGVPVPARRAKDNGGVWATPALGDGVLYVATHPGELLTIDTKTGDVLNRAEIGWHAWASPVIAGDTLIVGICTPTGGVRGYDISKPKKPTQKWEWQTPSGSCVESTPVVWNHNIYVGSRDGFVYKIGGQIEE
ncbi:MAG: PQQ-binding-like beta-propeller repeat protein, partial [Candidatus Nomurabacteria bacterium]|nr:PQQ-binding-like beta-propeller repeat protein [Candidatus Nomurabacteria bacterium]